VTIRNVQHSRTLPMERQPAPVSRIEARRLAAAKKSVRRRRTVRIRKTVAWVAAAAFLGPFGVIAVRMAAGSDPALATSGTATSGTAAGSATASRTARSDDRGTSAGAQSGSSDDSTSSSSGTSGIGSSVPSVAPVTTQQS
jgi:hypothetical protein